MKKNRTLIFAALAVSLSFGAGLFWRWVQGTPHYALYQIGAALKERRVEGLLPYLDLQGILNRQLSATLSAVLTENFPQRGGGVEIRLSPESDRVAAELVVKSLKKYLADPKNPSLPSSFALLIAADISSKEDYALVTLKKDGERMRLGMKREEGTWRVVELNHEDVQRLIKRYLRPKRG